MNRQSGRVSRLAREIGFDAVDAGPLKNARWLETLGFLNIQLGYGLGMEPHIGFKLVHEVNLNLASRSTMTDKVR